MKITIDFVILVAFFCLVECNSLPPSKPSVEIVDIKLAKPIASTGLQIDLYGPWGDGITQENWYTLCLCPLAYDCVPGIRAACNQWLQLAAPLARKMNVQLRKIPSSFSHLFKGPFFQNRLVYPSQF